MTPAHPRAAMQVRVCEAVERGANLRDLAARPGWPSRMTVFRWARQDAGFAARLAEARGLRGGVRVEAGPVFDAALAEVLLLRVRRGETVRALVRTPGMPNRARLDRWKAERPDFAAALRAAAAFSRSLRPPRWGRYDEAAGDTVIAWVARGVPLPQVCAQADLPGETALRRWRKAQPGFEKALRAACRAGHRRRMADRGKATPELSDHILTRLTGGESLRRISFTPGVPHYATLMAWQRRDPAFARMVAWARGEGEIGRGAQALALADRWGVGAGRVRAE